MKTSNNAKKFIYFIALSLLISFWIYDNYTTATRIKNEFTVRKYLENPKKYGGQKAEFMVNIEKIEGNFFYFYYGGQNIKVYGKITKPILGESAVFLNFRKDGLIELVDYHNYNYNYILYGISVIALIMLAIMFFKEWKLTWRGFKDA